MKDITEEITTTEAPETAFDLFRAFLTVQISEIATLIESRKGTPIEKLSLPVMFTIGQGLVDIFEVSAFLSLKLRAFGLFDLASRIHTIVAQLMTNAECNMDTLREAQEKINAIFEEEFRPRKA